MNDLTISQVSKLYDVTPRMLRHYEKLGLIETLHKEDYAYRMYDENAVRRLQQIIVLRKLRIPLKQIAVILNDKEQLQALQIMRENISELDDEIASLEKVRSILKAFVERLDKSIQGKSRIDLLEDTELNAVVSTLSLSKAVLKENTSMTELNKADEILNKNLSPRIILLPPFTVASHHYIGENPEEYVGDAVDKFIKESRLYEIKPDSRYFGFNHPNPGVREDGLYGYEVWVTVPDDMKIPEPLVKKSFKGGLYAAYTIRFPEFHYWQELIKWAESNDKYEPDYRGNDDTMGGLLEEHLNWVYASHMGWPDNGIDGQLDLLLPIKRKQ